MQQVEVAWPGSTARIPQRTEMRDRLSFSRKSWRKALLAYLLMIPSFVIIVVFRPYPVVRAAYISLHRWSIVKGSFVGLER